MSKLIEMHNHNSKLSGIIPVLLAIIVLAACSPAPDLRDPSFLDDVSIISGEPCEAPCWQDLVPGETAWGVAVEAIETSEDYTVIDTDSNRRTGEAWVEFAYRDGLKCCRIYTNTSETLTSILLLLAPQTTVAEVVARFGEPVYITAQAETSGQAYVALIYPDVAMVVYAFAENVTTSEIAEESDVVGVIYMSTPEMENLLQMENLYFWDGYGQLGDMIDGNFDLTPVPLDQDLNNQ